MNRLLLAFILLALVPIISCSISCYVGYGGTYTTTSGYDICYSWTVSGVSWKAGLSGYTCSSASLPSSYSCCSTSLCNGAKINGMSILMASIAAVVALFRAM